MDSERYQEGWYRLLPIVDRLYMFWKPWSRAYSYRFYWSCFAFSSLAAASSDWTFFVTWRKVDLRCRPGLLISDFFSSSFFFGIIVFEDLSFYIDSIAAVNSAFEVKPAMGSDARISCWPLFIVFYLRTFVSSPSLSSVPNVISGQSKPLLIELGEMGNLILGCVLRRFICGCLLSSSALALSFSIVSCGV